MRPTPHRQASLRLLRPKSSRKPPLEELDAMALVKARDLPEEQHAMLREAFDRQEILFLCDNLDRCGQHYKTIASYLARKCGKW